MPVTAAQGAQAVVEANIGPMPGRPPDLPSPQSCFDETERFVVHTFAVGRALSPTQALAAGGSSWLLVEGSLDAANHRMCTDPTCGESAPVRGLDLRSDVGPSADLRWYLVRVMDGALVDTTVVIRLPD